MSLLLSTGLGDRLARLLVRSALPFLHLSGGEQHSHRAAPQRPDPAPRLEVPSLEPPQQRSQGGPQAPRGSGHLGSAARHRPPARRRVLVTSRGGLPGSVEGVALCLGLGLGGGSHGHSSSSALRIQSGEPLPDGAFLSRCPGDAGADRGRAGLARAAPGGGGRTPDACGPFSRRAHDSGLARRPFELGRAPVFGLGSL